SLSAHADGDFVFVLEKTLSIPLQQTIDKPSETPTGTGHHRPGPHALAAHFTPLHLKSYK
ncbi:hypothetical protein, partial [Pseudomonas sp.]|uniref:hypothetical protein n=1 Tax=Pseudomonas sp. TaxID=306 RepID=UPI002353967E